MPEYNKIQATIFNLLGICANDQRCQQVFQQAWRAYVANGMRPHTPTIYFIVKHAKEANKWNP